MKLITAREAAERRRELLAASPLKKTLQFEG